MKTASKCLACMTGCLDPQFEPSVEDIVDYIDEIWRFSQFDFFGELAFGGRGGRGISLFSQAHGRWRSRLGQPAQAARPNIWSMRSLSPCLSLSYGGIQ